MEMSSTNTSSDHYLEEYWQSLKDLFKKILQEISDTADELLLSEWTLVLNNLKKEKRYNDIEKHIEKYLMISGWVFIKYCNSYQILLYHTHLKRWQQTPSIYIPNKPDLMKSGLYFCSINDNNFNLNYELCLSLVKSGNYTRKVYQEYFYTLTIPEYDGSETDEYYQKSIKRVEKLIPFLINDTKCSSIDIIGKHLDLQSYIKDNYGYDIPPKMKAKKIISKISKIEQ